VHQQWRPRRARRHVGCIHDADHRRGNIDWRRDTIARMRHEQGAGRRHRASNDLG
jgi:hypothetical protein